MADVFPPAGVNIGTPDWGLAITPTANVERSKLGDGYEYREPKGINHVSESFQPIWSSVPPAAALIAYKFLRDRLEWKAFMWVHPVTQVTYQVVASALSLEHDEFDNAVLKVTFTQDFNPIG